MALPLRLSSLHSTPSTTPGTTLTNQSAMQFPRARFGAPQPKDDKEFVLEAFIDQFRLHDFMQFDLEQKKNHLVNFDAMDLFSALEDIRREMTVVKLENHFLLDFLDKNDPKLLIGFQQQQQQQSQKRTASTGGARATIVSATSSGKGSVALERQSSKRSITAASVYTTGSAKRFGGIEYRLNYRAKIDMAEKAATDVEKRIAVLERNGMKDIKLLNARIEELKFLSNETKETTKNFQLHFMRDYRDMRFLETATEKQIERKFRKFINNWFKCARALLGTMRLRITALQENCQQLRNDLITKSDLSGILGAVDFEQLQIVRGELMQSLDDKNNHMAGLKGLTGKAALRMAEEKRIMMETEDESKRISNKTVEVIKQIGKLEKEANYVEECNRRDLKTLEELKEQCERYEAPSVNQYIEKKDELHLYEKEEKMLQRKTYIMNMKINNLVKKFKRRPS